MTGFSITSRVLDIWAFLSSFSVENRGLHMIVDANDKATGEVCAPPTAAT